MSDPFIGEIKLVSFDFAPRGWALCNGQLLPINQNQALFSLLGTQFGGNGQTSFALPDLRGRMAVHASNDATLGQAGGQESVTLNAQQMPAHTHALTGTADVANANPPAGALPAARPRGGTSRYAPAGSPLTAMSPDAIGNNSGGQAHSNMQPYLVLNHVIALTGIFPSRN
jgi:microcystin-dependent protein